MTTDFRALCAELLDEFVYHTDWSDAEELKERARAALADEPAVPLSIADAIATAGSEYLFLLTGKTDQLLTPDLIENLYSQFHSIIAGLADNLSRVDEPAVPEGREPASVAGQPSDEAWDALVERAWDKYQTVGYQGERFMYDRDFDNALEFVRQGLTRWGNPAPQPVPVSERLPGQEDCDVEGRCWWLHVGGDGVGDWFQRAPYPSVTSYAFFRMTHWLPAYALPLPGQEVEG